MRSLAFIAVAAFLLAGCASSSTTSTTTTSTTGTGMGAMHMGSQTVMVNMTGNKFSPDTITVYVGDTVKWTNKDQVGHTVTATSGATFDSSPNCVVAAPASQVCIAPGGTYTFVTDKVGDIAYHCKVHSGMTGKISVIQHPGM